MRRFSVFLMAIVMAIVLLAGLPAGCSVAAPAPAPSARTSGSAPPAAPPQPGSQDSGAASSESTGDRMIVRTASLQMVVADVDDLLAKAADLAKEVGGYVVSSQSQEQNGDRAGSATLRVPSSKLDESVKRLKGMATRVSRESSTAKDVTEEYVDQDARLGTLRATESQYLELMKSARTTDDILKIQQALGQVRQQIETTQARLLYLSRSAEMAVINLELSTSGAVRPLSGGGWNVQEVFYAALQGLVGALVLLAGLGIWMVVFAPLWIPTVLLIRWWRRRPRRPLQTPPAPQVP